MKAFLDRQTSKAAGTIILNDALGLLTALEFKVTSLRLSLPYCKEKPDTFALLLITNAIVDNLRTGRLHDRGSLSATGNEMMKIWDEAVRLLREKHFYTQDEADADSRWIREQINADGSGGAASP